MESAVIDREKATFTTNGDYEQTRQEITALLYVQEDEDFVRPTRHALNLTLNLLEDANAELTLAALNFPEVHLPQVKGAASMFSGKRTANLFN